MKRPASPQESPPPLKLSRTASEGKSYARILVDGFYGDHSDMTWQTYEYMCALVIQVVEVKWAIPWNQVIWICAVGTWMKAIPITLMQLGRGHAIEFYMPCAWHTTAEGYSFDGYEGRVLTKSMNLMQARLAESTKARLCDVPHLNVQLKQCVIQTNAPIFDCGDFKQQRINTSKASTHMIHLPHNVPLVVEPVLEAGTRAFNEKYYNQGGKSYEDKPPSKREQIQVYEECRKNGLGGGGKTVSL